MPRQPKPFFHRGWWVTDVGGTRTKLAQGHENRKQAEQAFHEMLAKASYGPGAAKTVQQIAVWELCEQFLDWVEIHRSPQTFTDYKTWLKRWVVLHGRRLARDIRPLDLEQWKASLVKAGRKPCTVNHAIVAVQTCWNWGVRNELLTANPLVRVEKLHAEGRRRVMTSDEFRGMLRHSDALFRQVLLVFRLTGVRPGEFRKLTWDHVNLEHHCWVIRDHKASRTAKDKKPRVVPMPPIVEKLLQWRLKEYGRTAYVFLNEDGERWTSNALRCRMRRLRDRARIAPDENGEKIVMYTARHSYATAAVASGVSDRRLADLMGHTTSKTTQRYVHLAHSDLYQAALEATAGYMSPK
jgi:integrase